MEICHGFPVEKPQGWDGDDSGWEGEGTPPPTQAHLHVLSSHGGTTGRYVVVTIQEEDSEEKEEGEDRNLSMGELEGTYRF